MQANGVLDGANSRFRLLEKTNDGFEIAEEDLRRRGMGELAGLRQAGTSDGAESLDADLDLVLAARDLVARPGPVLESYADLAAAAGVDTP